MYKKYVRALSGLVLLAAVVACDSKASQLREIKAARLAITDSLIAVDSIDNYLQPFRARVNEVLDEPLAYNPVDIAENDGARNTSAGNLMADIVLEMADPIYFQRTGKHVDMVVLNQGGVRSGLTKGPVTARNAYEMMPFENIISVITLNGSAVRDLISFLVNSGRAHPISGMQIVLNGDNSLQAVNIQGSPFDETRDYAIATSSYLVEGAEAMGFFPSFDTRVDLDYLLRNALVDYFKQSDTISFRVDDRFYQLSK